MKCLCQFKILKEIIDIYFACKLYKHISTSMVGENLKYVCRPFCKTELFK